MPIIRKYDVTLYQKFEPLMVLLWGASLKQVFVVTECQLHFLGWQILKMIIKELTDQRKWRGKGYTLVPQVQGTHNSETASLLIFWNMDLRAQKHNCFHSTSKWELTKCYHHLIEDKLKNGTIIKKTHYKVFIFHTGHYLETKFLTAQILFCCCHQSCTAGKCSI